LADSRALVRSPRASPFEDAERVHSRPQAGTVVELGSEEESESEGEEDMAGVKWDRRRGGRAGTS
jgi:hypothetical protein